MRLSPHVTRSRSLGLPVCCALAAITLQATAGCGDPATLIHQIQGRGFTSPQSGRVHEIEGILIGDFRDGLHGFFVQEEDRDVDSDPRTSEGIFVHRPPDIEAAVGDRVRVRGRVKEYHGLTELDEVESAIVCAREGSVTRARVILPVKAIDDFEAVEGMAVVLPQSLYISAHADFDRYNEVLLSSARHYKPTQLYRPGAAEAAQLAVSNSLDRITLDGGRQKNTPPRHPDGGPFNPQRRFRGGDALANVRGVMDYAFGRYRIQPAGEAHHLARNPRPPMPANVGGSLRIASFNLRNFFITPAGLGKRCGPLARLACRGAADAVEFKRQRDKLVAAILGLEADILGLQEVENHAGDAALRGLVDALNARAGAGSYAAIDSGPLGGDAIKVAFVYRPSAVIPTGRLAILDDTVNNDYRDHWNRPALAQTFEQIDGGGRFTLVVNHLKSRRGSCDSLDDPDAGDGQGHCNRTRSAAMAAEAAWLASDPTGSGDPDFLIIGDFNAYASEDPLHILRARGFTDLLDLFLGREAYTYSFAGELGYLDHALANRSLLEQVKGVAIWHINVDEPDIFDYRLRDGQADMYAPGPYRASDHDPLLIGLELTVSR